MNDEIDYSQYGEEPKEVDYSQYGHSSEKKSEPKKKPKAFRGDFGESMQSNVTDLLKPILTGEIFGKPGEYTPIQGVSQGAARAIPKLLEIGSEGVSKYLSLLGKEGGEALGSIARNPIKSAGSAAAGMGDLLQNLMNLPRNSPKILSELGLMNPETAEKLTFPYQFDFSKATNALDSEKYPGSELIRKTFENMPVIFPVTKALTQTAIGAGKNAAKIPNALVGKKNPLLESKEASIEKEISEKTGKLEEIDTLANSSKEAYREAQSKAKEDVNLKEAEAMKFKLTEGNNRVEEIKAKSAKLNEDLESFDQLPAAPQKQALYPENYTENVNRSKKEVESAERNLARSTEHHENASKISQEAETNISQHLLKEAEHDVDAAAKIESIQEAKRKSISSEFKELGKNLSEKNIVLSNPGDAKRLTTEINDLIKQEGSLANAMESPEFKKLTSELANIGKNDIIPANDYLTMYRATLGYARKAREKAFSPGMNAEERAMWKKQYDELDSTAEKMGQILEAGIGKQDSALLKKANKAWRERIIPMQRSRIYQTIRKENIMSDNIMRSLRGKDPAKVIMREIIQNDPDLLKLVVGQRHAIKPKEIYEANKRVKSYLDKMPELKGLLEHRTNANQAKTEAKSISDSAKKKHEQSITRLSEAEKKARSARIKESNLENKYKSESKSHEKELKSHEKKKEELKTKISNYESEIKKFENEALKLKKHIKETEEKFNSARISLKEKVQLGRDLRRLKSELKEIKIKVDKSSTGLRKAWLIGKTFYKLARKSTTL